ncbi:MAG: hypothetical protein QM831_11370 [Kofleriaceae bacterium]
MKVVVALCVVAGIAHADVRLVKQTSNNIEIQIPDHWTLEVGATIVAKDPSGKASLAIGARAADAKATEDAMLDQLALSIAKDAKTVSRGVPKVGRGRYLIAENKDGRMVAIGVIQNGQFAFGVMAAPRADFDALGGEPTLEAVMASIRAAGSSPSSGGKVELVGSWKSGIHATLVFKANGEYEVGNQFVVMSNHCTTSQHGSETGTYTFDGASLVLTPKSATQRTALCMHPATDEKVAVTAARTYTVTKSGDHVILEGPGCSSLKEDQCETTTKREFTH